MDEVLLLIVPPAISALILAGLMIFGLTRLTETASKAFTLAMACMFVWACGAAIELMVPSIAMKGILEEIQHIGISWLPISWLLLTLQITGRPKPAKPITVLLYSFVIILDFIILTDPLHHLFLGNTITETTARGLLLLGFSQGPFYTYFFVPFSYTLLGLSILILLESMISTSMIFRLHYSLMLISTVLPYVINIFYLSGTMPYKHLDPTPSFLSITGCLMAISIFRYRMLALIPMARSLIIETMQDGILVLDTGYRIIDYNPAAGSLLGMSSKMIGKTVGEAFSHYPEFSRVDHSKGKLFELPIKKDGNDRLYTVRSIPFQIETGRSMGSILFMHDTTDESILLEKLKYSAAYDSLTGILNRQTLLHMAEKRLSSETSDLYTVFMIDIDFFKVVNDSYGHITGDRVLKKTADIMKECLRDSDLLGRYGGEEFIALLNGVKATGTFMIAERIRAAVQNADFGENGESIRITLSLGISTTQANAQDLSLDSLIKEADEALYEAKETGRNRAIQYQPRNQ